MVRTTYRQITADLFDASDIQMPPCLVTSDDLEHIDPTIQ